MHLLANAPFAPATERMYVVFMMIMGVLWGAMIISNMTAIMEVRRPGPHACN